ncbi:MAG: hypothetical protein ACKOCH_19075, partial [Bacteroidota bacterium]
VAGTTTRSLTGWRPAAGAHLASASPTLASAWFSSRSQSAALSGFTYELERAGERNERGAEGRSPCALLSFRER